MVWFGLGVFAVGVWIRCLGIRELACSGMSWYEILLVQKPKTYIETGIYQYLKHPLYVGSLLMISGVGCMVFGLSGVILALPALPFYMDRITQENHLREGDSNA